MSGGRTDAPSPTDAAVSVHGLVRRFGEAVALDGVSFDVAAGELFGFIGPDGAGKTTLFRILTTVLLADSGVASVLGRDVVRDMWRIRASVGYMPGRFSLYPDLTVEENLTFFASVFGTTVQAQHELIAPIFEQIAPFRTRRAGALSGGMKQKLALSCALVHRPEILFLDEPTTGVDAVSRREFWDLLTELRAGGLTIVVSTPYMDEAARCDRVALMQGGRILGVDSPAGITAAYPLPLLAVRGPDRYRMLATLRGHPHARSVYPFGTELHFTDSRRGEPPEALARELGRHLGEAGYTDASVSPVAATIEDSFMELMTAPAAAVADG